MEMTVQGGSGQGTEGLTETLIVGVNMLSSNENGSTQPTSIHME